MNRNVAVILSLMMLTVAPLLAQVDDAPQPENQTVASDDNLGAAADRMVTPPPVSGQAYPVTSGSQERSNYLRGGLNFTSAYTDNALGSAAGKPLSDISYSIAPFLSVAQTATREQFVLTYAPGYTLYQRFSDRSEADQNASISFAYRLSPHVTFSANDSFQKSSSVFNQPDLGTTGAVNPGPNLPNFSVIAPNADRLSNTGTAGLTYQFELNDMVGTSGTFTNLFYPNPAQVPGLSNSSAQAGLAFWAHRLGRRHYLGATYQYQRLLAQPTHGLTETQTHAPLLFYTVYLAKDLPLSFFGGEQHSDTVQPPPLLPLKQWTPVGGASLSWRAHSTSFAISYAHTISTSPGLIGAVKLDNATASIGQQLTKNLSASASGGYSQNNVLGNLPNSTGSLNGHTISGAAFVQQQFGRNVTLQLAYTRLHQDYAGVLILASTPNTSRESISIAYHFDRVLGR